MYALGYTISVCEASWTLDLGYKGMAKLELLSYGLQFNQHSKGSIHRLIFTCHHSFTIETNQLLQMPRHILQKIDYLELTDCYITQKGLLDLVTELHSLKTLRIGSNGGGPGSLVALMEALGTHGKLETLSMEAINIGMEDISALSAMINASKNLTSLQVSG